MLESVVAAVVRVGHVEVGAPLGAGSNSRRRWTSRPRRGVGAPAAQVVAVGAVQREDQVEVVEVRRARPGARRPSSVDPARAAPPRWRARRAARRRASRRCPALSTSTASSSPGSRTSPRITPSAVGERQMLPMQTNRIRTTREGSRTGDACIASAPLPPATRRATPGSGRRGRRGGARRSGVCPPRACASARPRAARGSGATASLGDAELERAAHRLALQRERRTIETRKGRSARP